MTNAEYHYIASTGCSQSRRRSMFEARAFIIIEDRINREIVYKFEDHSAIIFDVNSRKFSIIENYNNNVKITNNLEFIK